MHNETIRGLLIGAAAGAVGMATMNLYWAAAEALPGTDPRLRAVRVAPEAPLDEREVSDQQRRRRENLSALEEAPDHWDGEAERAPRDRYQVPWGYGLAAGCAYGAWHSHAPRPARLGGLLFGAALWAVGDEGLPTLTGGRDGRPVEPWKQHAHRVGAHLAYGAATVATTQALHQVVEAGAASKRSALRKGLQAVWKGAKTYAKFNIAKRIGAQVLKR